MRLAARLGLILVAFAVAVLACGLIPLALAERSRLSAQLWARQAAEVGHFGRACGDALDIGDEGACLGYLKSLVLLSDPGTIAYAAFLDADGRVLIHTDFLHGDTRRRGGEPEPSLAGSLASPAGLRRAAAGPSGPVEVLSAPVYRAASSGARSRVGTAAVAYDRAAAERTIALLRRGSLADAAGASLPAIALALLLAAALARALSRPIERLRDAARLIGRGRLETRLADKRPDELGELAREFDGMAAKLAELDELKDSFLSQITHDLRNPLAAIAAHVDVLLMGARGPLNEKQERSLRVVAESERHLDELIGNILDLTKLEAGRLELAMAETDLSALSRSVVELMQPKAAEYGVALESRVPEAARVWADEAALRRVLVNLVSNALKFTPKDGRVRIESSAAGGATRVAVADTGVGIPPERLGALFQKFFQVAETKNKVRPVQGTGLGLVICKQLVELHGGRIGVESVYGTGTTFFFTLPGRDQAASK